VSRAIDASTVCVASSGLSVRGTLPETTRSVFGTVHEWRMNAPGAEPGWTRVQLATIRTARAASRRTRPVRFVRTASRSLTIVHAAEGLSSWLAMRAEART
jgi:hypothetical protein